MLRLLIKLCKDPSRLFITADANQSIYGSGFNWSDVHESLKFQGRTSVSKKTIARLAKLVKQPNHTWKQACWILNQSNVSI